MLDIGNGWIRMTQLTDPSMEILDFLFIGDMLQDLFHDVDWAFESQLLRLIKLCPFLFESFFNWCAAFANFFCISLQTLNNTYNNAGVSLNWRAEQMTRSYLIVPLVRHFSPKKLVFWTSTYSPPWWSRTTPQADSAQRSNFSLITESSCQTKSLTTKNKVQGEKAKRSSVNPDRLSWTISSPIDVQDGILFFQEKK